MVKIFRLIVLISGVFWLTTHALADSIEGDEDALNLPLPLDDDPLIEDGAPLWSFADKKLQRSLEQAIADIGLARPAQYKKLAVTLVDITDIDKPRMAQINGDEMMYAASLPKIAILLATFEKLAQLGLPLDAKKEARLVAMIRKSSNSDATAMLRFAGFEFIARVLVSYKYQLYDPLRNGGLWVGKEYGVAGHWRRDPINNISHGATSNQVARFYYLLSTGQLVNSKVSLKIKEMLSNTAINHKFNKGIKSIRPNARIYRKSGTWRHFHADSALIERAGAKYILVGLTENPQGSQWLQKIVIAADKLVGK